MNLAVLIPFTLLVGIALYFVFFRRKPVVAPGNAPSNVPSNASSNTPASPAPAPHEIGVERDTVQNARLQAIINDAKSFDRLVELSSSLYYPDYYIGFANHLPMTLIALKDFLERDTTSIQKDFLWLRDYFCNYEHRLTPLFINREKNETIEAVTDENWRQFLGKKHYYKAYFKYFQDNLDAMDILGVIDELVPGAATSKAFHPVIQLAYAMWYGNGKAFRPNLNMKRFSDGIRTMIVSSFAFWASYFQAPGVQLDNANDVSVAPLPNSESDVERFVTLLNQTNVTNILSFTQDVLMNFKEEFKQLMKDNEKEIKQGLIDSQLIRLFNVISKAYPGMLEALSDKLIEQLPADDEGLNQVIRGMHEFSQLMLMPNTQNILTLHCVTGSHALHIVWDTLYLSFASNAKQKKFIKSWFLSLMLVYIHQQFPELPAVRHEAEEVPENKWETLEKKVLGTEIKKLDEHDIKLLFTSHSMSRYYQRMKPGNEIQAHYFAIAADRLHATSFA